MYAKSQSKPNPKVKPKIILIPISTNSGFIGCPFSCNIIPITPNIMKDKKTITNKAKVIEIEVI